MMVRVGHSLICKDHDRALGPLARMGAARYGSRIAVSRESWQYIYFEAHRTY